MQWVGGVRCDEALDGLVGHEVVAIVVDGDREGLSVVCVGGTQRFCVTAECCSESWIEHVEMPDGISGAVITGWRDMECGGDDDGDEITVYQTVISGGLEPAGGWAA